MFYYIKVHLLDHYIQYIDFNFKIAACCSKLGALFAHVRVITKIVVHVPLCITRFYEISG
jgi:hypothetical protein